MTDQQTAEALLEVLHRFTTATGCPSHSIVLVFAEVARLLRVRPDELPPAIERAMASGLLPQVEFQRATQAPDEPRYRLGGRVVGAVVLRSLTPTAPVESLEQWLDRLRS